MMRKMILLVLLVFFVGCNPVEKALEYDWSREGPIEERMIIIQTDLTDPQVQFALQEILMALRDENYPAKILLRTEKDSYHANTRITIRISADILKPQGYALEISNNSKGNPQFEILGADAIGAMYGGLHLAEAIRIEKTLADIRPARQEPYLAQRGLKMTLVLDARTPGTAETGDSALKNYTHLWDLGFWTEFLDTMARYRYNTLVLWHPNPFPSMVKVQEYPDASLADVCVPDPTPDNLKVIKKMTIDEKIDHWRKVLHYAGQHGIRINVMVAAPAADTRSYRQAAVRELLLTYPDLADLIVEGENSDAFHSVRLYASDSPLLTESGSQTQWILNNDDILIHRWGDPDYVRRFLMNLPAEQTAGFMIGSESYVWGREFIDLEYQRLRPLEITKHRYSFMLWGRLGYNPNLDRTFFEKVLKDQFPTADPAVLLEAWQAASAILLLINRFHWAPADSAWSPEGCMGESGRFHTVLDFIDPPFGPMPGSGLLSIPDTVSAITGGSAITGITPLQVADELDSRATEAIEKAGRIKLESVLSVELGQTLADIEAMAWLGKYYAAKIRGAFDYALYKSSGQINLRTSAVEHLRNASECWRTYAQKDSARYAVQNLARTGKLDWWALWEQTRQEMEFVRKE